MRRWVASALLGTFVVLCAASAGAQVPGQEQWIRSLATQASDLTFPAEPATFSALSSPQMAIYKPEGAGPFPAIVLQHQCGGLRGARGGTPWENTSMLNWARTGVAHGYVVLLIDSLGPRGVQSVCMGPRGGVNFPRGVRDAFQAADYLRTLPYVDPKRVVQMGFSWGAMVGLLASRAPWEGALASSPDGRFRAVASLYPGCFPIRPRNGAGFDMIATDVDTPLLVLMGGEDTETPATDCMPTLEALQAKGAPVQWHLYPQATHCFDCVSLDGFRKTDVRGHAVQYHYDKALAEDAEQRVFTFFDAVLGPK